MSIIFIVETMFDCTICNRQFKSQTGAKLHMKVKHGSKGKSCITCNLLCHSKAELDRSPSLSFFSLTACLISKAFVTIVAGFCPDFNPLFLWHKKYQTKMTFHINNLVPSEFLNRSSRSARSFTCTLICT